MKLKTLKDFTRYLRTKVSNGTIDYDEIKAEAIKRINDDIFKHGDGVGREMNFRMMEYLDITEGDLK